MNAQARESKPDRAAAIGRWLGPVLFATILIPNTPDGMTAEAHRLLAVVALMSTWWLTQAIPIAATSLVPLILFPLLGIENADGTSRAYINKQVFLFLGGFIIAMGIERWGLHERLALHVVRILGTSLRRVILGFMLATGFLSMWISNTASTLLMTPIGLALIGALQNVLSDGTPAESAGSAGRVRLDRQGPLAPFGIALMLGIAWSASIGGMTTLVGTVTNVQFLGIWEDRFPGGPEINAGSWLAAFGPVGFVLILITWGVLVWKMPIPGTGKVDRSFFTERLRRLGRPSRAEWSMLIVFALTALLWTFRKPLRFGAEPLLPGWQEAIEWFLVSTLGATHEFAARSVHDSTVAVLMAVTMFLIPSGTRESGRPVFLMDWETAQKLPWAILLLVGGGFAIAGAFEGTKLADWMGQAFAGTVGGWPTWALVLAVCLLMTFLTEFATNAVMVAVILPVLATTAVQLDIDPRLLMLPATVSASCAFMLPIGTPPNAIVFSSGVLTMGDMAKRGVILNFLAVILLTLATVLYLAPQLGIDHGGLPEWASPANMNGL